MNVSVRNYRANKALNAIQRMDEQNGVQKACEYGAQGCNPITALQSCFACLAAALKACSTVVTLIRSNFKGLKGKKG